MSLNYRVGGGLQDLGENGDTTSIHPADGGHIRYCPGGGILHFEGAMDEGDYYTAGVL